MLTSIEDDKGEDVLSIPLAGKTEMADHMVVATGRSSRQVAAMAEHIIEQFKAAHGHAPKAEGLDAGDWVLLDCGDVLVHLFRPEVRDFYQLEKMWLSPQDALARRSGD
ncbi:MAG: ribosome silencing factor [Pseudomonadota bacterium]